MSSNDTAYPKSLLRALLLTTSLVGFQAASGCGLVASDGTGSETHWLMRCDSDADCGVGLCGCGVCTKSCSEDRECSELGVTGVRCAQPDACSDDLLLREAPGGWCSLLCEADPDCAALGSRATCARGRCDLPQASAIGSAGDGEIATLCDGSDDVRFVSISGGGFVDEFYSFAETYGAEFYAIDGRCNYWHGYNDGFVYSGTLSESQAQSFAQSLGFGRLSRIQYIDDYDCDDGGFRTLWSTEGHVTCTCDCGGSPGSPAEFRAAFAADTMARSELLQGGAPVDGAAQLLLIESEGPPEPNIPGMWPLGRTPSTQEILPPPALPGGGYSPIDEDSGALITDAAELTALRSAREEYKGRVGYARYTPLVYFPPGPTYYYMMLLRDEVPPNVKTALQRALDTL
jgi:hypothetical protein